MLEYLEDFVSWISFRKQLTQTSTTVRQIDYRVHFISVFLLVKLEKNNKVPFFP